MKKKGTIVVGKMLVEVKILETKDFYGKIRHKITPVSGSGEQWMEKVTIIKE